MIQGKSMQYVRFAKKTDICQISKLSVVKVVVFIYVTYVAIYINRLQPDSTMLA